MKNLFLSMLTFLISITLIASETNTPKYPEYKKNPIDRSSESELDETVNIWPDLEQYWTGSIRFQLENTYTFFGTDIIAGGNMIGQRYRGFARFDLSDIPDGVTIQEIELTAYTSEATEDNNHALVITELPGFPENPDNDDASDVWDSMDNWYIEDDWDAMHEQGNHSIDLNEDAIEDLQAALDNGDDWWGIGFMEDGDNNTLGVLAGYTSRSLPHCEVTYTEGAGMPAPSDVIAEYQLPDQMVIEWTDNSEEETQFTIEMQYKEDEDDDWGDWEEEGTVEEDVTTYEHELLEDGYYQYRVMAENEETNSRWIESNEVQVILPPDAPSNVTAEFNPPDEIEISWVDEAFNEAAYLVGVRHRPIDGDWGEWETVEDSLPRNSESSEYTPESAGDYIFRVASFNVTDTSDWMESNEVFVTPFPETPSGFIADFNAENSSIIMYWIDNSDFENGFRLEWKSQEGQGRWSEWDELTFTEPNVTDYEDTDVRREAWYQYRIRAENEIGESDWVESDEVFILSVPDAPSDFLVEFNPDNGTVTLSWLDNSDYESNFRLARRSHSGDNEWDEWSDLILLEEDVTEYTDTEFDFERYYQYRIRSANEVGESGWVESEEIFVTGVFNDNPSAIPIVTKLTGSYPNPFNSRTTINYQLHQAGTVSIRLFDIQGRLVRELVRGSYSSGYYSESFDFYSLPSGIYFVRMNHQEANDILKIMIIK
ncbi:MAG: T9SS type A sorting domain-containing protein [Candidatus Electryonea clarkiae]|nr:T9SS type A sorting domain-containing protein [Candidatus Electryonea clarkiae]MDP8289319.1 T9SS type A sorting domain-containing protein [Candidatus Electryonea clarkiae]